VRRRKKKKRNENKKKDSKVSLNIDKARVVVSKHQIKNENDNKKNCFDITKIVDQKKEEK
jgi:hypothetical protein